MMRIRRPSPAMVVACIALVLALGGTGYAAIKLPKNSVGSAQIKKNAVTSIKVKNGSLTKSDFKAGQLPAGAKGDPGAPGVKGDKGDKGDQGIKGDTGSLSIPGSTLASGQTLVGAFGLGGPNGAANDVAETPISFQIPLATSPTTEVVQEGGAPTANCPGSPTDPRAAAGYLCLYVGYADQLNAQGVRIYGTDGSNEFRWGGVVYIKALSTLGPEASGTWAVTAP
jgi:hypothetical protein